jgi:hypothetical protein
MSGIAGISVVGTQAPRPIGAVEPIGVPKSPISATSSDVTQPAIVVNLSSGGTAQPVSTLRSLDPDQVDNALSWAAGANGFADAAAHFDWAAVAAKFGRVIADRDRAGVIGAAASSTSNALSHASVLGIPIKDSVGPEAVKNGTAPGTISIGAFSFTSGGSTYAVAPGANGTLIGTKDGQALKTWQLTNPADTTGSGTGAAAALQTLTSLNTQYERSGDTPMSGIDLSAGDIRCRTGARRGSLFARAVRGSTHGRWNSHDPASSSASNVATRARNAGRWSVIVSHTIVLSTCV